MLPGGPNDVIGAEDGAVHLRLIEYFVVCQIDLQMAFGFSARLCYTLAYSLLI